MQPGTRVFIHEFDEVAPRWRELCRDAGAAPFHWPDWYQRWARAFATDPIRVVAAHRGAHLVGVLPLLDGRGALRSPVNGHTPYFGPVLRTDDALDPLLEGVIALARKSVVLQRVPLTDQQQTAWHRQLAATTPHRRIVAEGVSLTTDVRGSWEEFVASRSPSRRRELRRAPKRVRRGGRVVTEVHRGRDALDLLDACFALEAAGWKGREGTAIANLSATHRFYQEFGAWAAGHGWLRLTTLRVAGQLAAFSLDLEHGGVLYLLKTAYAEDLAGLGPGTALSQALVREAFDTEGVHRLEWLGDDASKRALGNGEVPVHQVIASPPGVTGAVRHAVHLGVERTEDFARRSMPPRLRARLRATRARRGDQQERVAIGGR